MMEQQQNNVIEFTKKEEQNIDNIMEKTIEGRQLSDKEIEQLDDILGKVEPTKIPEYDNEEGEYKKANTILDPNTGELKIVDTTSQEDDEEDSFEDMVKKIDSGEINIELDNSPITENELKESINNNSEIGENFDLTPEAIQKLLEISNRRMKKESFNVYKEFPDEVKKMVDNFIIQSGFGLPNALSNQGRSIRNDISESLIDSFIGNIQMNRAQIDLNKEIENVFKEGSKDITEYAVGFTEERNKKYREYAESMEDEEKKEKLLEVLDTMESAYNLDILKEFALDCKIKAYDVENPNRVFDGFLAKYKNSTYNIYDIKLTVPILERNFADELTSKQLIAFLISFCKYTLNFNVENINQHVFMYYFIYNIIVIDTNTSEKTKSVSDKFKENIKAVVENLKKRNEWLN